MKCSFALVAIIWRWCLDKSNSGCVEFTIPLISEISNQNSENNGVNRAGPVGESSWPGRCSLVRQRGLSEQKGLTT